MNLLKISFRKPLRASTHDLPTRGAAAIHAGCESLERRNLFAVVNVTTAAELLDAVNNGAANDQINVAAGTYVIAQSLKPKAGMIIDGAGRGLTTITGDAAWAPGTIGLPDNGTSINSTNRSAYLFSFNDSTANVKIKDMTLTAPQLHGAILSYNGDGMELSGLEISNFRWSGVRTFAMDNALIHDNTFINAGGTVGSSGGCIFVTYMKTSEIWNNTFSRTNTGETNVYGIKGREGRYSRIHDNTIKLNFSIEFPFENDYEMEIDHNYLSGTVSIPKYGGGSVPAGSYSFHLHNNYFKYSYSLEFARKGVEVDHNLFDFSTTNDVGNLITNFGDSSQTASQGPIKIHDNLIKNPGRGLYNSNGAIANDFQFYNNSVIGNTTITPRTEGLFGFPSTTNFSTVVIKDNTFEMNGTARKLFKNTSGNASVVENNTLTNISDSGSYANTDTGAVRGPTEPLLFNVGNGGEYTVNGWNLTRPTTAVSTNSAFVRDGSYANTNYGSNTQLLAKKSSSPNNRISYVKFDTSAFTSFTTAKLRLFGYSTSGSTSMGVYSVADQTWDESTLKWNNKPALSSSSLAGFSVNSSTPRWYEIDLTSYIQQQIAAGQTNVSLAVKGTSSTSIVTFFDSDEGTNPPQLLTS